LVEHLDGTPPFPVPDVPSSVPEITFPVPAAPFTHATFHESIMPVGAMNAVSEDETSRAGPGGSSHLPPTTSHEDEVVSQVPLLAFD
jgi:hypothetical protein